MEMRLICGCVEGGWHAMPHLPAFKSADAHVIARSIGNQLKDLAELQWDIASVDLEQ